MTSGQVIHIPYWINVIMTQNHLKWIHLNQIITNIKSSLFRYFRSFSAIDRYSGADRLSLYKQSVHWKSALKKVYCMKPSETRFTQRGAASPEIYVQCA